MAAGAGFCKVAEFGDEAGAEKKQDDREVPQDGEKIEAVSGARVGDGFLVFFGREVVGGGGVLGGCNGGGLGDILRSWRSGLERNSMAAWSGRGERDDEECEPEQVEPEARRR
jgi:hypothetical protein